MALYCQASTVEPRTVSTVAGFPERLPGRLKIGLCWFTVHVHWLFLLKKNVHWLFESKKN